MDKQKILKWMTIGIIIVFVLEMFFVLTYAQPAQPLPDQSLQPTPRIQMPFAGVGIAQAQITQISSKIYAACTPANATTNADIENALSTQSSLSQATIEAEGFYSAIASNETLSDGEKLSALVQSLEQSLEGKCLEKATILREGFIQPIHGASCENPFETMNATDYENVLGLANPQTGQCKNTTLTQMQSLLRAQGLPGIPSFLNWNAQENQTTLAKITAKLLDSQPTFLLAEQAS